MPGLVELVVMTVLAIIFPPLPVLLETGCSGSLLLSVLLTILGWIPGVIFSIYIILIQPGQMVTARAPHLVPTTGATVY